MVVPRRQSLRVSEGTYQKNFPTTDHGCPSRSDTPPQGQAAESLLKRKLHGRTHVDAHALSTTPVSRLNDAMALLDPQSRRVMELWLEGASPDEISHTLGLSGRAVMVIRGSSLWILRDLIAQKPTPEDTESPVKATK